MPILLLGGTSNAKQLARALIKQNHQVIYSLRGDVRQPDLPCPTITGGFSRFSSNSINGLATYCESTHISLIVDATHPYAAQMSQHAVAAATKLAIPLVQLYRSPWLETSDDHWIKVQTITDIPNAISHYQRPFFTIGQSVSQLIQQKTNNQPWLVRQIAQPTIIRPEVDTMQAIGPFQVEDEIALMKAKKIDVLISKNSGDQMSFAKISAARSLHLPVVMLQRPAFNYGSYCHHQIEDCVSACQQLL